MLLGGLGFRAWGFRVQGLGVRVLIAVSMVHTGTFGGK